MNINNKVYLECSCSSKDHVVCLTTVSWEDEDPPTLYLNMQMRPEYGFFRRVWTAIRYILKSTPCEYGCWNETIISPEEAQKLIEVSTNYLSLVKNSSGRV